MSEDQAIVIVSGLPRSGTSLMMKMLQAGGVELLVDDVRKADADNPKGYYEFESVKTLKDGATDWLPSARGKAVKVVAPLLRYLPEGEAYKILFMRRDMVEILASQRQMLIRRDQDPDAVSDEMLAAAFEKQLDDVQHWMESHADIEHLDVDYRDLVREPAPIIERVVDFLGGRLDAEHMSRVVDPSLYRQRVDEA